MLRLRPLALSWMLCVLASCSDKSDEGSGSGSTGDPGAGGGGPTTSSGAGQGGAGAGAGVSSAGPGGTSGSSSSSVGSGGSVCGGDVLETLPIDATGWIPRECTIFDIQGAWYCYDDGITDTSCVSSQPPYKSGGMCLSGTTLGPVASTWGGGIGAGLNETGGMGSMKLAFDATAHDVVGFAIDVTGDTGGNELRIGFTGSAAPSGASPFVPVPGPGSYSVMIADALVPTSWNVPNAGATADPSAIYDVQVQIDGNGAAAPFDFCITSLTPILSGAGGGGGGGNMPPPYGNEVCGDFATITLPGKYLVHNNVWNDAVPNGAQCISALWDGSSDVAGFVVEPSFDVGSSVPGSYPSIIYGWHYNYPVPAPYSAKQVQSVNGIPTSWGYAVPPAQGKYDVSYDLWVHPQQNPPNPNGGLEIMVWTNTRDTTPIGANQGYTVNVGGADWEVWYGSAGAWNTVSYRRVINTSSVDFDLLPFVQHAVSKGYAQNSWYLLGVEAGFEIWNGFQTMTTSYYEVSID